MSPVQSVVVLLALVALAFSPMILRNALSRDRREEVAIREANALPDVLSPVQAYARHLYGEAYGWSRLDMFNYDRNEWVREPWEAVAKVRITDQALLKGASNE